MPGPGQTGYPREQAEPGLQWTGHPLVDAGVAALTALAGRQAPEEVTPADLERFVEAATTLWRKLLVASEVRAGTRAAVPLCVSFSTCRLEF